jgi:lipid-A-disaccharide synthase
MSDEPLRIGVVAGEASGDLLGAELIRAVREQRPEAVFEGVGGARMKAAGCRVWVPASRLSVMGLVEVLEHLPQLLRLRRELAQRWLARRPDVFIGIDAPDFNLALERRLRRAGIPVLHYVSPSVWAWRRYRVRRIAHSVDAMLALFPFEADFYRGHRVSVHYVGHPLADSIPVDEGDARARARRELGLDLQCPVLALLPGSRAGEVGRLAEPFVLCAEWVSRRVAGVCIVAPLPDGALRERFQTSLRRFAPDLPVTLLEGDSLDAMRAADVVLVASGTATLEAMLLKRPMVVAYRTTALTHRILSLLLRVPYVSLPNLLAGRRIVPEFLQDAVDPEAMGEALLRYLNRPAEVWTMTEVFTRLHRRLRRDAARSAAGVVLELVGKR